LLTTNDKTIKLWNVHNKTTKQLNNNNNHVGTNNHLSIPTIASRETSVSTSIRRVYSNAHAYHINSVSMNSDAETFISSDDLRINLWNMSITDQSFNIVDIKPANMEELTEVITSSEFHPQQCNLFMYSSSKGNIRLGDMRSAALCDQSAKVFEEEEDPGSKSFFSEIISSISDIKFSRDGRYILARDYLTLKVWDINMEAKPVRTIRIHDYLRSKLCDLYENDCIFDKFECNFSPTGDFVLTGSYNNLFSIHEMHGKSSTVLEATRVRQNRSNSNNGLRNSGSQLQASNGNNRARNINPDTIDFNKKCLHVTWHPKENLVAVGASNNMFIFAGEAVSSQTD